MSSCITYNLLFINFNEWNIFRLFPLLWQLPSIGLSPFWSRNLFLILETPLDQAHATSFSQQLHSWGLFLSSYLYQKQKENQRKMWKNCSLPKKQKTKSNVINPSSSMILNNSKQHHYQNYFQQTFKSNDSNFKIENKTVLNL